MNAIIPVHAGDYFLAIRGFLRQILEHRLVDGLYLPLEVDSGATIPALVLDPERLASADPLSPMMPINGARAVSSMTNGSSPIRLGAVLRPCEIRALVELVKLQQASLEGVLLIGIDCPGTYELPAFLKQKSDGVFSLSEFLSSAGTGSGPAIHGMELRSACQMCIQPTPENVDIHIQLFGANFDQGIPIALKDELGAALQLEETADLDLDHRSAVLDQLIATRSQNREQALGAISDQVASNGGISSLFAHCIRCHNCMTACPICYCKNCLFRTAALEHEPAHYVSAARQKGAIKLLGDSLLFHLTRLHHMSASCVNCGMCTSACPVDIPVGQIFSAVGAQVQAVFDYAPGRDMNEALPLVTFQADEWIEVGEAQ